MPAKIRKVPRTIKSDDAEVRAVHTRYFATLGQTYGRVEPYGGPAWRADFAIKWGKSSYRRTAWLDVRETVKGKMPGSVFKVLDEHFTDGAGERFLTAFSVEERERMQTAMRKGGR